MNVQLLPEKSWCRRDPVSGLDGLEMPEESGSVERDIDINSTLGEVGTLAAHRVSVSNRVDSSTSADGRDGFLHDDKSSRDVMVSAVVSTCNAERFIRGCIEDLEAQTLAAKLEIIVVDSGSQQNERNIIRDFQDRYANIKYLRTERREGVYAAWNRGIKLAAGKYITNANTDDRHRRDAFERMVEVLEMRPDVALVYADVIKTATENETFARCTPTGRFRWFDWDRNLLLTEGCFIGPQPMWRRSVHQLYGYFDEALLTSGDYEFWLRISQTCDFCHIGSPLGLYLMRPDSIEHRHAAVKVREDMAIVRAYRSAAEQGIVIRCLPLEYVKGLAEERAPIDAQRLQDALAQIETLAGLSDRVAYENRQRAGADDSWPGPGFERRARRRALRSLKVAILGGQVDRQTLSGFVRGASALILHETNWFKSANRSQRRRRVATSNQTPIGVAADVEPIANQWLQSGHCQSEDWASREPGFTSFTGGIFMKPQDKMYQHIQPLLDNANCDQAIRALTNILESFPDLTQAHNDLGTLYVTRGDKDRARMHFEQAARLEPENKSFQKNLADFYYGEEGRIADALQIYRTLLRGHPEDVETLTMAGHLSVVLHEYDHARGYYERVMTVEPWNWEVQQNLEQLKKRSGRGDGGRAPEDKYQRIQAALDPANPEAGIDALQKLLQEHPDFALAHNDLGVLYYEAADKQKALAHYERAAELQPDNLTFKKNLADFYYVEQGRVEDALKIYVDLLAAKPEDVETLLITGHVCVSLHKFEDAKVFYERVLEIEPWNSDARENLERLSEIEQRNVKGKTADEMYGDIQHLLQGENPAPAVKALKQLLDVYPDFALAHNDLAVLLYQSGQTDKALDHYERAVKLEPDNLTFQKNLADFYFVEKARIEDAMRVYVKILERDPEDVETLMAIGKICETLQQPEDARTFYERVLDIEPWNLEARERLDFETRTGKAASG